MEFQLSSGFRSACGRGQRDREGGGCIRAIIMQRWGKSGELSDKKQMTLE